MSELKYPPITEVLKRRFQSDGIPSLSDTIVPTIELEGNRPEYEFLRGARLGTGFHQLTGSVNTTNWLQVGLINPTGSKVLLVTQHVFGRVRYNLGGADAPSTPRVLRLTASALPDLHAVTYMRDFRWDFTGGTNLRPVAQVRSTSNAAELGNAISDTQGVSEVGNATEDAFRLYWIIPGPIVIPPGEGIAISVQGRNPGTVRNLASFMWLEYTPSAWEGVNAPGG